VRVPEPAAAPKRVHVVDAIPLTAVGKVFKPELRRRATEAAARDALAGLAADVSARLADGQVVVTVGAGDEQAVRDALAPFAFEWEHAGAEAIR
jgi:fatty-acyl-CoA synthase